MLYKRSKRTGAHWWVRFEVKGIEVRQSSGTDRKNLAEAFEQSLREAIWREQNLGQEEHTWEEACERWLKEKAHKRSIARDEQAIKRLGIDSDAALDSRSIQEALAGARELAVKRSILNACVKWGWLDKAPKVEMPHEEKHEPRWITKEQFEKLCKELPPHAAALARFAVATGMRSRNVFRLKWEAVDLVRKRIRVAAVDAKGGRSLGLPLSAEAAKVVQGQRDHHGIYVFVDHAGRAPIGSIKTAWGKAVGRAGLKGFRFHDLRHTWAAWHTLYGTPPIILKELGGWSSLTMVEKYSALNPGHLADWADNSSIKQPKKRKIRR